MCTFVVNPGTKVNPARLPLFFPHSSLEVPSMVHHTDHDIDSIFPHLKDLVGERNPSHWFRWYQATWMLKRGEQTLEEKWLQWQWWYAIRSGSEGIKDDVLCFNCSWRSGGLLVVWADVENVEQFLRWAKQVNWWTQGNDLFRGLLLYISTVQYNICNGLQTWHDMLGVVTPFWCYPFFVSSYLHICFFLGFALETSKMRWGFTLTLILFRFLNCSNMCFWDPRFSITLLKTNKN